jgi:hypothetical protein
MAIHPQFYGSLRLPCLAPPGHITTDKREIKDFPKLPSATFLIRKMLYAVPKK